MRILIATDPEMRLPTVVRLVDCYAGRPRTRGVWWDIRVVRWGRRAGVEDAMTGRWTGYALG